MRPVVVLAACAALFTGCGEQEQAQIKTSDNTNRSDVAAWKGADNPYAAKGWTPGSKGSWENHIRARGQLQNEYVKAN